MKKNMFPCLGNHSRSKRNYSSSSRRPDMEILEDRQLLSTVNLSNFYNEVSFTRDGTRYGVTGGVGGTSYTLSSNLVTQTPSWNNLTFSVGSPNVNNSVSAHGQTIPVSPAYASKIDLLGFATGQKQNAQVFKVLYSDGTSDSFAQGMSTWQFPLNLYSGESTAIGMGHENQYNGSTLTGYCAVYGYQFSVDPSKITTAIVLPSNSAVHVAAIDTVNTLQLIAPPVASTNGPYIVTQGDPVDVQGFASGGVGPYTFSWDTGQVYPDGTPAAPIPYSGFTYYTDATTGPVLMTLTVTDATGATATATTSIQVNPKPTITAPPDTGPAKITTPTDSIPNFGYTPTSWSIKSGAWSDPHTWSNGIVPTAGAVVDIAAGNVVTFDLASSPTFKTVAVLANGELDFRTTASSTLNVGNLEILPGGIFTIGTSANPVPSSVQARVVFADQAIDTSMDPSQYGTGLVDLGTVKMVGSDKADHPTLASEAHAGASTIILATPATGWLPGDRIVFPDTRQLTFDQWQSYSPQWESATVASVASDGRTVTLTAPLQFDHLGARDMSGVLRFLPQVMNLSRNITLTSANPAGTRAHTMFTGNAKVDIENVDFLNLGRTTDSNIDSTTFNSDGTVAHLGTNQIGRYPLHVHHDSNTTFTLTGNAIDEGDGTNNAKWGITVHGSNGGLIQSNDVYNVQGSGIVTEDGTETNNTFDSNMVVRVSGDGGRADGAVATQGYGFWFSGPSNIVTNNIVADIHPSGDSNGGIAYELFFLNGQNNKPINVFDGNTAYGATNMGMEVWYLGNIGSTIQDTAPSVIHNTNFWHINSQGLKGYPVNNLTIDGFTFIDDLATSDGFGTSGIYYGDYLANNLTITNADIEGATLGIVPTTDAKGSPQIISHSYFANRTDIKMVTQWTSGASGLGIGPRRVDLIDDVFDTAKIAGSTAIQMLYGAGGSENLVQLDQLFVTDYNGVVGDNFEVFYNEQAADFIVPQTIYAGNPPYVEQNGSPVAGLTNAQNWAQYGIAIAGAVAPSTARTRTGIIGLVN